MNAKTLKLPILLSTILSPLLGYFFMSFGKIPFDISNFLILWVVLFILIIIFQAITQLQDNLSKKAEKQGENLGKKLFQNSEEIELHKTDTSEIPEQKTLLKEIVDLAYIGEYLTLAISMIPLILIGFLKEYITKLKNLENWELLVIAFLTFIWILLLEKIGKFVLKVPLIPIPIPLKWAIVAVTLYFIVFVK